MAKSKFQLNLIVVTLVIILLVLLVYIVIYSKREGFRVSCRNNRKQNKKLRYLITSGEKSGKIVLNQPNEESLEFNVYRNGSQARQLSKNKCKRYRDTLNSLRINETIKNKKYNKEIGFRGRGGLQECESGTWSTNKMVKQGNLECLPCPAQKIYYPKGFGTQIINAQKAANCDFAADTTGSNLLFQTNNGPAGSISCNDLPEWACDNPNWQIEGPNFPYPGYQPNTGDPPDRFAATGFQLFMESLKDEEGYGTKIQNLYDFFKGIYSITNLFKRQEERIEHSNLSEIPNADNNENGYKFYEKFLFLHFLCRKTLDTPKLIFSLTKNEENDREDYETNVKDFPSQQTLTNMLGYGNHSVLDALRNLYENQQDEYNGLIFTATNLSSGSINSKFINRLTEMKSRQNTNDNDYGDLILTLLYLYKKIAFPGSEEKDLLTIPPNDIIEASDGTLYGLSFGTPTQEREADPRLNERYISLSTL